MTKKEKMLPSGFCDLLFEEAKEDYYIKNSLVSYFLEAGFNIIKTPLLEFAENFDSNRLENSFSTVDVISGKNLVLRNDITLQIERLLETRLKDAQLPLKLCYEGDVFLMKNDGLYSDRQLTQSGIEIIGCNQDDYLQVIDIASDLMSKLVNRKLIFEFSIPGFAKNLCKSLNVEYTQDLQSAINRKNLSDIAKILDGEVADLFCALAVNFTDLDFIADRLSLIGAPKDIIDDLQRLFLVRGLIEDNYSDVEICYNVFGDDENSYHSDIAFQILCEGHSYPLLKGGKYKVCDLDAVGATFYVDQVKNIR